MQNILITGATGFIGKHLVRRFSQDKRYRVIILVRENSNLNIIKDYKDKISIYEYKSDYQSVENVFKNNKICYVFHLATLSCYEHKSEDISDMVDSNIKLGTFILESMKKYQCQYFINTSTYWQNYQNNNYQPICLYAATKEAFEKIIDYYCLDKEFKAISLKLYDVYGYDDHRKKLLNTLLTTSTTDSIDLTEGEQKLYMVFIDDVIDAYINAMSIIKISKKQHSVYGVYGKDKYSLKEIIKILQELSNKKFNINFGKIAYHKFQIMDPFNVKKLPKWNAKISLKNGLKIILDSKKNV
jgi:nucleoside-diphosphate-sugar epimerase